MSYYKQKTLEQTLLEKKYDAHNTMADIKS